MNNKIVWIVAWHEYITNLRRPGFIIATLFFPALGLLGLIVATFFSRQASDVLLTQIMPDPNRKIGVIDFSGLFVPIPEFSRDQFTAYTNEDVGKADLKSSTISALLIIPADYVSSGAVTIYTREANISSVFSADSVTVDAFLINGLLKDKVDASTLNRVNKPSITTERLSLEAETKKKTDTTLPKVDLNNAAFASGMLGSYVVSIVFFSSIFSSANYLLRSISDEKENRIIEILVSSILPVELLAGKIIGLGALGMTQVVVWISSTILLSGGLAGMAAGFVLALNPVTFILAVIYFILGYLLYAILMATSGALGTTMRESQQIASIFTLVASIPWLINVFLFMNPDMFIARVLSYIPLTAPMMMILRLGLGLPQLEDIVGSILILLVCIPIFLWGGAKIFHTSLMMYGKRLSLKEIWKVLRST